MLRRLGCLVFVLASCTDALPCSACPAVEGAYAVTWQAPPAPTALCNLPGPRPATWTFTRVGSAVRTTITDVELGGTLYDTYDFALSGGVDSPTYSLRGRAVLGQSDAGVRLVGSLRTRTSGAPDAACDDIDERFTADRQ